MPRDRHRHLLPPSGDYAIRPLDARSDPCPWLGPDGHTSPMPIKWRLHDALQYVDANRAPGYLLAVYRLTRRRQTLIYPLDVHHRWCMICGREELPRWAAVCPWCGSFRLVDYHIEDAYINPQTGQVKVGITALNLTRQDGIPYKYETKRQRPKMWERSAILDFAFFREPWGVR